MTSQTQLVDAAGRPGDRGHPDHGLARPRGPGGRQGPAARRRDGLRAPRAARSTRSRRRTTFAGCSASGSVEVAHSANLVVLRTPPGPPTWSARRSTAAGSTGWSGPSRGTTPCSSWSTSTSAGPPMADHLRDVAGIAAGAQDRVEREGRGLNMPERVVLAYSGGLDTSVAVRWLIENEGVEVIAVAVNVGQAADRGGEDWDAIRQPRPGGRRRRGGGDRRPPRDGGAVLRAGHPGQRPLRGQVPARLRAVAPGDRAPPGGRGAPARRRLPSRTAARARATTRCASRWACASLAPDLEHLRPGPGVGAHAARTASSWRPSGRSPSRSPRRSSTPSTTTCGARPSSAVPSRTRGRPRPTTCTP